MTIFNGIGVWTAWDPDAAQGLAADWIAVPRYGTPPAWLTSGRLVTWEPEARLGPHPNASAYIAQIEGPDQYAAATDIAPTITVPKAVVTNLGFTPAAMQRLLLQGWEILPEAYEGTNPAATPLAMAAKANELAGRPIVTYPVVQCTAEGQRRFLSDYLPELERFTGWSVYLAEELTGNDVAALANYRAPAQPPPPKLPPDPATVRRVITSTAAIWEAASGGPQRHARITTCRRIAQTASTDARWLPVAERIALLLDNAGIPQ